MASVELDSTLIEHAAPAGSMRYFSLLYADAAQRRFLAPLYVIEIELHESSRAPHEVAHIRLQWWQEEIQRLSQRRPQHPATRALLQLAPGLEFDGLQDALLAAAMDLACATFDTENELTQYFRRSSGALFELAARHFLHNHMSEQTLVAARESASLVRQTETLRDLRRDVYQGRVYLPLSTLDQARLTVENLKHDPWPGALVQLLQSRSHQQLLNFYTARAAMMRDERTALRPLLVLAGLHARLAQRMVRQNFSLSHTRVELHPLDKVWTAWRSARVAR